MCDLVGNLFLDKADTVSMGISCEQQHCDVATAVHATPPAVPPPAVQGPRRGLPAGGRGSGAAMGERGARLRNTRSAGGHNELRQRHENGHCSVPAKCIRSSSRYLMNGSLAARREPIDGCRRRQTLSSPRHARRVGRVTSAKWLRCWTTDGFASAPRRTCGECSSRWPLKTGPMKIYSGVRPTPLGT